VACGPAFGDMPGTEDFDVVRDADRGVRLLVSAYDRRVEGEGGLWSVSVDPDGVRDVRRFDADAGGCPLRPHGVSFARGADGTARLYVVQHGLRDDENAGRCTLPRGSDGRVLRHQVLVYRVERDALVFESRLADPLLRSPNDLSALPDGTLYVSNEITDRTLLSALAEYVGLRAGSDVVHFDPHRGSAPWRRVLRGPRFPNGVLASGDRLYVAGTLDRAVHVYRRDTRTGDLTQHLESVYVGSGVDNLMLDEGSADALLTAAHPDLRAFLRHRLDPSSPSPWEIWRITPGGRKPAAVRLLRHDGRGVSAAATAARIGDAFYAGQVFGRGLTRCLPVVPR
jgi:sugar lactone lactonase YvrE